MKALPDRKLWKKHNLIAGVDEAGRGPLAGPVVAAAVILPKDFFHPEINDSKKLAASKRERLYGMIIRAAIDHAFGVVDAQTIDTINILEATKSAMHTAITTLNPAPQFVLIDALKIDELPYPQFALIKGDTLSISIAAASILAKVKRDAMMREYHRSYPQYQFHQHKGYPTKLHRACIRKYGSCPIHRKTFRLL
ncbi:MAG: ribonuclease HII [candidate division WOR-3 bacterium]